MFLRREGRPSGSGDGDPTRIGVGPCVGPPTFRPLENGGSQGIRPRTVVCVLSPGSPDMDPGPLTEDSEEPRFEEVPQYHKEDKEAVFLQKGGIHITLSRTVQLHVKGKDGGPGGGGVTPWSGNSVGGGDN